LSCLWVDCTILFSKLPFISFLSPTAFWFARVLIYHRKNGRFLTSINVQVLDRIACFRLFSQSFALNRRFRGS
jgi:hypothetical protein